MSTPFKRRATAALLATASAVIFSAPAFAQSSDRNAERLTRLENAVRDLQATLYSVEGQQPGTRSMPMDGPLALSGGEDGASTVVRIQSLERELARLTGEVEELRFRYREQQRQIETIIAVLGGGEVGMGGEDEMAGGGTAPFPLAGSDQDPAGAAFGEVVGETPPQAGQTGAPADLRGSGPVAAAAPAFELPDNPDDAYDVAYEALLAGDYDRAEAAFEAFVERFPDAVQTADAKYLLGEIYLAGEAYAKAATVFLDHVRAYPDDPRAPEAYLKLGTAFSRLDKTDEACRIFEAARSKFPQMSGGVAARLRTERQRAGCPA